MEFRFKLQMAAVTAALLLGSSAGICKSKGHSASKPAVPVTSTSTDSTPTAAIDSLLRAFKKAVIDGNAQTAAALWSEDAIFIDESGDEIHGRNALQQRFETLFKSRQADSSKNEPVTLEFEPERVTFPAQNVAMIVGVVSKPDNGESVAATRFSMMAEKHEQQWLIAQATETRISSSADAHQHLTDLAWLLGNWKTTTGNGNSTMNVEWVPGKNFLRATIGSTDKENTQPKTDTQVIGWDQRTGSIVSWYFGYHGNFSYGKWKRSGPDWIVDVAGVASDGSAMRESNVFSGVSKEKFTWQSTDRTSGGASLPDTQKLTVERVSGGSQ